MTEPRPTPSEAELQAWVDDRLAPERRLEVAAWLAERPEERARLETYRRQTESLRAALDAELGLPVPPRMLRAPRGAARRSVAWAVAAGLAGLVIGGGAGWLARDARSNRTSDFAVQAAVAHEVFAPETRHPVEVSGGETEHLATWLGKRLGGPLAAPDLTALGYRLVGGRLLATESGPAAQLMYEDDAGERMTLYLRTDVRDEAEHAWRFAEQGDTIVYYWVKDGRALAVVGGWDRATLEAAGDLASAW